uniref:Abortive phage infection protein n=1 Tax=Psychrobacter sp. (strain PRwf-1) TaxID=349106 RepID=A5WCW0_PSYWF
MNYVTIKTEHHTTFSFEDINKVIGTLNPSNIAKLLDTIELTANPRKSKINKITNSIQETLELTPEYMVFKSKGLLLSTGDCQPLERGRFKMRVEDDVTDGLLDGGHNMLAIGMFFLKKYFEKNDTKEPVEYRRIRRWDDFLEVWSKYREDIGSVIEDLDFLVPVELIYPAQGREDIFSDKVFEISDARNNNHALTSGTKADHKGYFEALKDALDPILNEEVEWKDNDIDKTVKRNDIVSLALIPLIALQRNNRLDKDIRKINPTLIYNSKEKCVETYSLLIEKYTNEDGEVELPQVVVNAFKLMKDIPKFYDLIYKVFPDIYNSCQGSFGRISSVSQKKDKSGKVIKGGYKTKFYNYKLDYKYPDAFMIPIIVSLNELIKIDGDEVTWKIKNMEGFIENNLKQHCGMLISTIKDNHYDSQSVGKSSAAYKGMEMELGLAEMKINN